MTAAIGWERDGETTILFRKKLTASGFSDQPIENSETHVIWAQGQEDGDYYHRPSSGLEKGNANIPDFYRPDEIKYHGKKNRGIVRMNFFDEVKQSVGADAASDLGFCGGEWKYPRTCEPGTTECEYFASWRYDENTDSIDFVVQSTAQDRWTGIGFSDNPAMAQSDVVIGYVENSGRVYMRDMWTTSYLAPIVDPSQDLKNREGYVEDGITTLKFSRKRNTGDGKHDVSFTDDKGLFLIFPVKGGKYNAANGKIKKHEHTPTASSERVFIKPCRNEDGTPTFTTTPRPAQVMYGAKVKFVNLGDNFRLPTKGSREYTSLKDRIARALTSTTLSQVPGFEEIVIEKFRG